MASSNYQNLPRQNYMSMSFNALQTDASCSLNNPNQSQALSSHCPISQVPGSPQKITVNGLTGGHQQSHLLQQNQQPPSQENQQSGQQPLTGQSANGNTAEDCSALPVRTAAAMVESGNKTASTLNNAAGVTPCSTDSFMTLGEALVANSDAGLDLWQDPDLEALLAGFSS